jgi:hypothetical protein
MWILGEKRCLDGALKMQGVTSRAADADIVNPILVNIVGEKI